MSTKKKDKLLLNLLEGERYKHRVAMVTDEGAFNQHEPNSNMARMFVVMLLIHVVVIGGIIVYDFMNGEEAPKTALSESYSQKPASAIPAASQGLALDDGLSLEEYSTYEWKSGDSIPSVASKLKVSEAVLIKLNKLDQDRQLNTNDLILYPKRPVQKAVGISVAGTNGELARPATPDVSIAAAEVPMNLAVPEEPGFSFTATIEDQLTPVPQVAPGKVIEDSPPPAASVEASGMAVLVELPEGNAVAAADSPPAPAPAVPQPEEEKPVIKAIPYTPPVQAPPVVEKAPVKKVVSSPPPARKEPVKPAVKASSTHTVQSGETMYRIASKHGITVAALQAANKNAKPESLQIGMKLVIPGK